MIEIDRFYNAALANPTTVGEEFRDRADAAQNPQRVRRVSSADERDNNRATRDALRVSIPDGESSIPQAEVLAIKAKLGVDNTARESGGRPLETRTVREAGDAPKTSGVIDTNPTGSVPGEREFNDAVDREVDALLNAILSLKPVSTPGNETPGDFMSAHETPTGGVTPGHETPGDFMSLKTFEDFRTAVGDTIRDIGTSIKSSYSEMPPDERTPEDLSRALEMIRKAGDVCLKQMAKAARLDVNFTLLMAELIRLIASVAAAGAILSAVASVLKISQVFLEAKWTAETAETELMTREAKERLEEMLEKVKQIVEDLKLKLKLVLARAKDKQSLHEGRRVAGARAPAATEGLQLSSALLVLRRLEDTEKLVAGYERRMKERHVAGDAVKVM